MQKFRVCHYQEIHGKKYLTSTLVFASSMAEAKAVVEAKFPNHKII